MATINKQSFTTANAQTNREKGPLVRVELSAGRSVKMYRADVEAQGLRDKVHPADKDKLRPAGGDKALPAAGDKLAPAQGDKAVTPAPAEPDDFATIRGVGKATARALVARGITTFGQLRAAGTLDYVTPAAMAAIEDWRNG